MPGLSALSGYGAISDPNPFATAEERTGGIAEQHALERHADPQYLSQLTRAGSHGPYGAENQLLSDTMWFLESAGSPDEDPQFDYNTPSLTRSHGSVHNIVSNGTVPSQADSIHLQLEQMDNKRSDLGTSRGLTHIQSLEPLNDVWHEIWEVDNGSSDVPDTTKQIAYQANGYGVSDSVSNAYHKTNMYGYNSKHMHRRYAAGKIPGNFMWMRPQGRPLFKSIAGVARPPVGGNSPFAGQDVGAAFSYDTGAVLLNTPEEYIPPPMPNIATRNAVYDNPYGTDGTELW
jgi:hypothetical protein